MGEEPGAEELVMNGNISTNRGDMLLDTVLRASDYEVRPVPLADGRAFIIKHHYSKGCSNTAVYVHGLFRKNEDTLLGVAQWLPPTRVTAVS